MSLRTLNDIFSVVCQRYRDRVMMQREALGWVPISTAELYRNVVGVALTLKSWGIGKGDRVAILSENRPEWTITDFAALSIGAVTVPIYSTQTADQTSFILNDSGAKVIAVSTKYQLEKVLTIQRHTPIEHVLVMDAVGTAHAIHMQSVMLHGATVPDAEFDRAAADIVPDDLATIIYTSGTTGAAKGVMLTHGNMTSNVRCSLEGFDIGENEEVSVSFLPLSHVTARHVDFALLFRGVVLAYCPDITQLPKVLTEVKPDIFVGVPRVYEKIRQQVILQTASPVKNAIYRLALKVGRAHRNEVLSEIEPKALTWKFANRLVFSKVREGMGGRRGSLFQEERRWGANLQSGTRISAYEFTRDMG